MLIMLKFVLISTLHFCMGFNTLWEGDVAVPRSLTGMKIKDSFLLNTNQLWSNGIVPFRFEKLPLEGGGEEPIFSDKNMQMIRKAMAHISEKVPCIRFREISSGYSGAHLIFSSMGDLYHSPSGCWAYVGCQGAQGNKTGQTVNLGSPGCFNMGTIVHEILHSLGATHEQNRADRNSYVKIMHNEISEDGKKNFEKKVALFSSHGTPYDYDSVMHYDEDAFSKSGKKTIIPLMDNIKLNRAHSKSGLSPIDTMELARVYDQLTAENCYKMESIMEYLNVLEGKLKCPNAQCSDSFPFNTEPLIYGPHKDIWSDSQCLMIGVGPCNGNLQDCKDSCMRKASCTAINFNSTLCVQRACPIPIPVPGWNYLDYKGYSMKAPVKVESECWIL